MITKTLHLRFTTSPLREPRGWFLPGDRAEQWLMELCGWDIPHSALQLLIVPHSAQDPSPIGLLVVVSGDRPIVPKSRSHAYGLLAGRLYLPVEARLEPAVSETELRQQFAEDRLYVWHPAAGLVGFDAGDVLAVEDLLAAPSPIVGRWGTAHPGIAYARRLVSIDAIHSLSVEMILQSGQDDIGTESDSLDELPPSPGEKPPRGSWGPMLMAPLVPVAWLVQWIASKASATASHETWIDRLTNWANRVLSPEQQSARERELARLMNLLNNDPDKGLKYAIPMGNDAGRGIAPPSTTLTTHDVDFRFSSGGGLTDYWNIPPATLHQLTARYRELAEREIRLRRHRRAAYIYAELLGEMESAAAALKSGGYYREAAVVYEERLHRPHDAAACLEEGGLWDEAINRYEPLGEFEKCGAICRRLEQHDKADMAYRKAAEACCDRGDLLRGAKLYEEECRDPERALTVLRSGWPDRSQSQDCLRAELRLLGRGGRHADAGKRVQELIGNSLKPRHILPLAEVLAEAAGDYPDESVRAVAADGTQVIVSRKLVASRSRGIYSEDRRLLRTIEKLAPEDRLLNRDCERYLKGIEPKRSAGAYSISKSPAKPELLGVVKLPPDIAWHRAASSNRYFFAAGYCDGQLVLMRVRAQWNSNQPFDLIRWSSPAMHESGVLLAPSPNDTHDVWVHPLGGPPLPPRLFAESGPREAATSHWFTSDTVTISPAGDSSAEPRRALTPPWTTRDTIALAQTAHGASWTVAGGDLLDLSVYSADHVPIVTRQLSPSPWEADFGREIPIHARPEGCYLGLGDCLLSIDANQRDAEIPLAGRIVGLSGSAPHSRIRVAASFEEGGVVFWKDTQQMRQFGYGLNCPRTAFTVTGKLIAADESKIEIYDTSLNRLSLAASLESPGDPLSVMPFARNHFAVFCTDGQLSLYGVTQ